MLWVCVQVLLAKRMGKKRIIAETGAGQHGVATATVCARFGLECIIYMGAVDIERQVRETENMRVVCQLRTRTVSRTRTDRRMYTHGDGVERRSSKREGSSHVSAREAEGIGPADVGSFPSCWEGHCSPQRTERIRRCKGRDWHGHGTRAQVDLVKRATWMGAQALNVFRMRLLGASVRPVTAGTATLKDATSEAIRDWVTNVESTHYILGSAAGPHPYPMMVRLSATG